jgi:MFS family permease
MAGLYNTFRWLGNILAGWTTYGSNLNLNNSWAWRTPTIVQAGMPGVVMCLILFFPESPRWLIAHGRPEEALVIFAKYHGDDDENSPIVQPEYHEIVEQMNLTHSESPWWDFHELVNTRAARYRLCMVIGIFFFCQLSENNVVSYFMASDSSQPAEKMKG